MSLSPADLARKYCVDDLRGAAIPGTTLQSVLEAVEGGRQVSARSLAYLSASGLDALRDFATGTLSADDFRERALGEQAARLRAAQATQAAPDAQNAQDASQKLHPLFEDPAYLRKLEDKSLKRRFGLGYVGSDIYRRVMQLVRQVDGGQRLSDEDMVWLSTREDNVWTSALRQAYHRLEALARTDEWRRTGDAWAAVNASGHWRKAGEAGEALMVTEEALVLTWADPKVTSALKTTRGGAMRDMGRLAEAKDLGHAAQRQSPKDFRPCTLLGAVYIELHDFETGRQWYLRAERLGADTQALDQDLRSTFFRLAPEARKQLSAYLLAEDARRFGWVRKWDGRPDI